MSTIVNNDCDLLFRDVEAGLYNLAPKLYIRARQLRIKLAVSLLTDEDLRDLVQETLIAISNAVKDGKSKPTYCQSWCVKILANKTIDHLRRIDSDTQVLPIFPHDPSLEDDRELPEPKNLTSGPENQAIDNDRIAQIILAIRKHPKLSKDQKHVVLARGLEGLSGREIADELGMTETNVNLLFHRAVKKLNGDADFIEFLRTL